MQIPLATPGGSIRCMPEGFHPPLEEYLETIHELGEEGTVVIQARLAERLGHSAPAVSEMVKRLRDEGYVEVEGRSLSLTAMVNGWRKAWCASTAWPNGS